MAKQAKDYADKLTRLLARLDNYVEQLSLRGIDLEQLLAQEAADSEIDLHEQAESAWKHMCADAVLLLAGEVPESSMLVCRVCGQRKSKIDDFPCYYDMKGKPIPNRACKACLIEKQRVYLDRHKTVSALRKRLTEIERASITCRRCKVKKPPLAFPSEGHVCLGCKVEIFEALVQSLRERLSCNENKSQTTVHRSQARGEYAGKRLQQAINQSDGTLSVEVIGRLFAEAEGKMCPYCGTYMSRTTKSLDHMVPLSKGGVHGVVNLIICCKRCNSSKRDRDFADWISKLKEPYASLMAAEYEQRYGANPAQSQLPFQYVRVSKLTEIQ